MTDIFGRLPRKPIPRRICKLVLERDDHACQVCGYDLRRFPDEYECGHIIDRFVGGSYEPDNLVAMCRYCNQRKPFTPTRAEYDAWAEAPDPALELLNKMLYTIGAWSRAELS